MVANASACEAAHGALRAAADSSPIAHRQPGGKPASPRAARHGKALQDVTGGGLQAATAQQLPAGGSFVIWGGTAAHSGRGGSERASATKAECVRPSADRDDGVVVRRRAGLSAGTWREGTVTKYACV